MSRKLNIFYADDDPDDLNFFRDVASTLKRPVNLSMHDEASTLIEALEQGNPDEEIVFLDLNMPGKDGFDILQEIRKSRALKKVPVVILSTTSDASTVSKCLKYGANFYVQKANSYEAFRRSIEDAISIDYRNFRPSKKNFLYRNPVSRQIMF